MKKILSLLAAVILSFGCFVGTIIPKNKASAANDYSWRENYQMQVLEEFSGYKNRLHGTTGEKQAASFIKSKLDELCQENSNLSAVSSSSTEDGVQEFNYTYFENEKSQNLIYFNKASIETDKKVIIACNYDAYAYDYDMFEEIYIESEAINGSAGSVAALLTLAKALPTLNLPYNVEIVFFGAGEANNAGSDFYIKGIDEQTKQNILCMINIDSIAVGKNLYFYVDEVNTAFSDFVGENLKSSNIALKQVDIVHLGKIMLDEENKLGLGYNHIAMTSDNINFMKNGITSINLFAGDYDDGVVYGRCEYLGKETINYTQNDNLDYISENYGQYEVSNNLSETFDGIVSILKDDNFENICLSSQNSTKVFYGIFGSQQIIAYLSVVILFIMIAVICYIHLKLSIKSYDANVEPEFLSTVISISQHIDETCTDENVPKAVSQVIAHDIKKDKTIKVKKSKKKDS